MKRALWLLTLAAWMAHGQAPARLTIEEAEALAVKNHPQLSAASLTAAAAAENVTQARSAFFPTVLGSVTGAGAQEGSRIAAGFLNNPIIYNRFATGFTVGQLVTDFGRTSNLAQNASLRAQARQADTQATRQLVLLQVDRAYFAALRAQTVLRVAEETVAERQLVADQVTELARSKLKSGLDVSFAQVNLSEARLLLANARNEVSAAFAELSTALGDRQPQHFELADPMGPGALPDNPAALIAKAIDSRPELASLRLEQNAALKLVQAERALQYPSVSALVSAGVLPAHQDALRGRYSAGGVNVTIPVFNGRLFSSRRAEADLREQAAAQHLRDLENRVARDVQIAWLNASTAFERLGLTAQLLAQAAMALNLAQSRYELGLSSIVELSQAQLNKTSAEIASASAKYDYQLLRAVLDYQAGIVH